MSTLITLGDAGNEITLSDTTRYAFPPDGFKKNYARREIFRERRVGGSDLSYSRVMYIEMKATLVVLDCNDYQLVLDRFNDIRTMIEKARKYWRTIKDNPNDNPPVYYKETFFNQSSPTTYLVQTGECTEGRLLLAGGGIMADLTLRCDAPDSENPLD